MSPPRIHRSPGVPANAHFGARPVGGPQIAISAPNGGYLRARVDQGLWLNVTGALGWCGARFQ
jgi:hypothetical protein